MKRKLLLAALCVVGALGFKANAQEAGTYYIQNVGNGKWLGPGNGWGTQASVLSHADYWKLAKISDGVFTLESVVSNGGTNYYLNADGTYCDGGATNYTFTAVNATENIYNIAISTGKFLKTDGTIVKADGEDGGDAAAKWKLYTADDLLTLMAGATAENPVDATWLIKDHDLGRNNRDYSSWINTGATAPKSSASNSATTVYSIEALHKTFDVNQTITVPNGTYELKVNAFYRQDGTDNLPYLYANDSKTTFPVRTGEENDMQSAAVSFVAGNYLSDAATVVVKNKTLTIGVATEGTYCWCIFKNFHLSYLGPLDLTDIITAYDEALSDAKATAATEEKVSATVISALNTTIATYEGHVDKTDIDALENATDALTAATEKAKSSIASYAIIASGSIPDNSLDGWVCENTQPFHINTWSVEGNSDGSNMKTPFIENWVGKGSYLGSGKVYYQLEGLEPGEIYYAQALVRSYNEANSDAPNGPNFFINDAVIDMTEAGTTFTYNNMSGIYATLGGAATVGSDGILTLGVEIAEDRNYNWVAFKNVSIRSMEDALAEAVDKAELIEEGTIPTAAYTELQGVISQYNKTYTTAAEYETAIDALTSATEKAETLKAPYTKTLDLISDAKELQAVNNNNSDENSKLAAAALSAETEIEKCTTVEGENTTMATLKAAMTTYVFAAAPEGEDAKFDLNFLLTNPDLTGLKTWAPADGWLTEETDGNSQVMVNDAATSEDGTKTYFYEYWSWNAKADNKFTLYLSTTLPAGTYSMSCYAFAKQQDGEADKDPIEGVYFYANDVQGGVVNKTRLTENGIDFINKEEQEVKIGLKTLSSGNTYNWMGIGYVQLYKVPASTVKFPITTEGDIEYTVTVDGDEVDECLPLETVTITVDLAKLEDPDAEIEVIVTDEDGNKIDSPKVSEGVYTFQMVAKDVTVKVSLPTDEIELSVDKNAKWATFISTFDFELNKYTTAFTVVANADGSLNLTEVADGIVPANTPVVVQSSSKLTQKINRSGVRKKATNKYQEGSLQGVVAEAGEQAPEGSFVLQMLEIDGEEKVNFYIVTKDADITVPQYKAYLMPISSNIKAFFLPEDDEEATAIAGFEVLASGNCDAIYTANGVKVNALQKGLNIVKKNGKSYKIYVK